MSTQRERLLDKYSARVYKNRKEHITQMEFGDTPDTINANTRTVPGIMTARGCCYAGLQGRGRGAAEGRLHHHPRPHRLCAYYSWGTRRNRAKAGEDGKNFLPYCICTDMRSTDIVFGGEKKLQKAIDECMQIFDPKVHHDLLHLPHRPHRRRRAGHRQDERAEVRHHRDRLFLRRVQGRVAVVRPPHRQQRPDALHHRHRRQKPETKFSVNILGEYNIGSDAWEEERILKRCGIEVVNVFTGDGSYENMKSAHLAESEPGHVPPLHQLYRRNDESTKYGIDWIKVNFIGVAATCESLRMIGKYFGDPKLIERIEEVIADELETIRDDMEHYRLKLKGKTAGIFSGGSRSHHYQKLLEDFGVETVIAGYEFAHRDDYEGREVSSPTSSQTRILKTSRRSPSSPIPSTSASAIPPRKIEALRRQGVEIDSYDGMMREMQEGAYHRG